MELYKHLTVDTRDDSRADHNIIVPGFTFSRDN